MIVGKFAGIVGLAMALGSATLESALSETITNADVCKAAINANKTHALGRITDPTLTCLDLIAKRIDNIDPFVSDMTIDRDVLWTLVSYAGVNPAAQPSLKSKLLTLREDALSPLRNDAWLALATLPFSPERSQTPGSYKTPIDIDDDYSFTTLLQVAAREPGDASSEFETHLSQTIITRLRFLAGQIALASTKAEKAAYAAKFTELVSILPVLPDLIRERVISDAMQSILLVDPNSSSPMQVKGDIAPISWTIEAKACANLGPNSTSAPVMRCDHISGLAPTPSIRPILLQQLADHSDGQSQGSIQLMSFEEMRPDDGTIRWFGGVWSFVRGGYQVDRNFLGAVSHTEDFAGVVEYEITGSTIIPKCIQPEACNITALVFLSSQRNGSDNSQRPTIVASLHHPDGSEEAVISDAPAVKVDRTLGDTRLEIKLGRHAYHTGSCCFDPGAQQQFQIVVASPRVKGNDLEWLFRIPPGLTDEIVDKVRAQHPLQQLVGMLNQRAGGSEGEMPIGEVLGVGNLTSGNRYYGAYLRLLVAHVLLYQGSGALHPSEQSGLTALIKTLSGQIRASYGLDISQQTLREGQVNKALEDATLTGVIETLIRDTALQRPIDQSKLSLLDKLSGATGGSSTHLEEPVRALQALSASDSKVDALVQLYSYRERLSELRAYSSARLVFLTTENAQLHPPR